MLDVRIRHVGITITLTGVTRASGTQKLLSGWILFVFLLRSSSDAGGRGVAVSEDNFPRAMSRTSARRGECRGGEQLKRLRTCHGAAGRGRALVTSSWRPQSKSDLMILNWIPSTSTRPHSAAGWDLLRVDRHGRHNARGIRLFKYLRAPTVAGAGELAAVTGGELQNFAGRQKSNYTKISNFPFIGDCRCRHHRR